MPTPQTIAPETIEPARPDRPRGAHRIDAIDRARGLAVLLMVATHATDAFLSDAFKGGDPWYAVDILFGFVAPAFAFLSGVTLWAAGARHPEEAGPPREFPVRTLRRFGLLLLLGYWLQIPVLSLRQLVYDQRPEQIARTFDSNILQVIALSGMALLALSFLMRRRDHARAVAAIIACGIFVATPYVWADGWFTSLPVAIRAYFSPTPPATFGLFPFAGYVFAGFAASAWLIRSLQDAGMRVRIVAVGILLLIAGPTLTPLLADMPPHANFWGSSTQHALFRLGGLLLPPAFVSIGARARRSDGRHPLIFLGRRSLGVYIVHLVIIYGSPLTMGMRYWFGGALNGRLSPPGVFALAVLVLAVTATGLYAWEQLRAHRPAATRLVALAWWLTFAAFFLLNP